MLRNEPDEALAALVRQGHESAFVAIYDRHHRGLIAFCRHMLSSKEEAEDALQHTFLAAYKALTGTGRPPKTLKPWLYTIAHNRCVSMLRARRAHEPADDRNDGLADPGLADVVQRRADLRDLLGDLHRLPEDQKAALVLFEMGDFSHADIAETLSVTREKVKALVFQAREGLLRARTARDTPCAEIRRDLSSRTRALPRRGVVRGHLDRCPACAAFDLEVRRQRASLALILPVVPSLELKASVLGPMLGGGATIAGGGALIAGGSGAGGIALGGAGAAGAGAGAGAAGTAAAGGVAGLATSAGGLAGAGAASGLGALAAKTVVAKALTVVAVATAAAGTGKVAEEVHQRVTAPSHAVTAPAKATQAPSVVTSNEPTTTTLLPATHITQTTTTSTPATVTSTATTAATPPTSTGGTATVPASPSSSTSTPAGGGTSSPQSSPPAEPAVDPTTGGTTAPAVVVNADPPPPASTPATDPPAAAADPPAATQDPPAASDPNAVAPPAGTAADQVVGIDTVDQPGATPPGCPQVTDPTATVPQVAADPVVDATPAAGGATAADPGATGANAAPDACPPVTPAAGSAAEPAAGATVTASDAAATAAP